MISVLGSATFDLSLSPSYEAVRVDDRVLLLSDGLPTEAQLDLFDVSDPAGIEQEGSLSLPARALAPSSPATESDLAFVNTVQGIQAVDISDPLSPVEIGSPYAAPEPAGSLALRGDALYLGGRADGVLVVDVSDPTAPVLRDVRGEAREVNQLWIDGDRLYVTSQNTLLVYDITDPLSPVLVFGENAQANPWRLVRRVAGTSGDRLVGLRFTGLYSYKSCGIFTDDFETGTLGAWSGAQP
ncbi:MAG: hypothetical protein AAF725_13780 [Acidobacteriota bacterium]